MVRFIRELSEEVHSRLDKLHVKGKTITLKLKVRAEGAPKETAKFMGETPLCFFIPVFNIKPKCLPKSQMVS